MRLVDNDGKATSRGIDFDCVSLLGHGVDGLTNERKFLNGRNYDRYAASQRPSQLLGIVVNFLNDALLVLKLIDCVLKLLVEHQTICNDNNAIENFLVGSIV
jgi:hypothetical protein